MTTTLTKQQQFYTPEEYRSLEEKAEFRSEYRDGEVLPMIGGTINHNRIVRNLCTFLQSALRGKDAEVFVSDLRLWIPHYQRGTYPDLIVIQGKPAFHENRQDEVLNPILIIEVLSPSTQNFDRENKFRLYRSIPQLQEYILVSQEEYLVEQYLKQESGKWLFQANEGQETKMTFSSLGVEILMQELYENVFN